MMIVSYPNLQGGMNTNTVYREALRRSFYRSYGADLVMGPMMEAAQEVIAEQTAIAQVKIDKWKSDHPGVKITPLKENNLKTNIPQSAYHAMIRVQKNFKDRLISGQKRVEMTKVAEDIADKDYYDKKKNIDYTGHVIGVAIFDKVVPPPKSGERDMRVGHEMHKEVNTIL